MQQPPQGTWQWVPAQPARDTRFIRSGWEWLLFLADCAAIVIIFLVTLANVLAQYGAR